MNAIPLGCSAIYPHPDLRLTERLQRMIDDINTATRVRPIRSARDEVDVSTCRTTLARAVDHLHEARRSPTPISRLCDQRPPWPPPPSTAMPTRSRSTLPGDLGLGELVAGVRDHGRQHAVHRSLGGVHDVVGTAEHRRWDSGNRGRPSAARRPRHPSQRDQPAAEIDGESHDNSQSGFDTCVFQVRPLPMPQRRP